MIIKGGSRGRASQLATHLQRTDTNERVKVLELQSPAGNLTEAFRDWQTLAAGTKGWKGLYHANIDPAEQYRMTPEQWKRSVDVLEKELGLEGQPRAIVLHEKHGREHIHVVWSRTDIDSMKLRSDSGNYKAHERASKALEIEFGHELTPGKHEKRDRERQPEPPKAEISHAEWQQAERTGISPKERKEQITALYEQSDNGKALQAALLDQGYILAQGDKRSFVIVDEKGEIFSLPRMINGVNTKALREFMADIDLEALPSADKARALQRSNELQKERSEAQKPPAETQEPQKAPEQPDTQEKAPEAAPEPAEALLAIHQDELAELEATHAAEIAQKTAELAKVKAAAMAALERKQAQEREERTVWQSFKETLSPTTRQQRERIEAQQREEIETQHRNKLETELSNLKNRQQQQIDSLKAEQESDRARHAQDVPKVRQGSDEMTRREIWQIEKALTERHAREAWEMRKAHRLRTAELKTETAADIRKEMAELRAEQKAEREAWLNAQAERRQSIWGYIDRMEARWSPAAAAEKRIARAKEFEDMKARQKIEREDQLVLLKQTRQQELEALQEQLEAERRRHGERYAPELERYLHQAEEARKMIEEMERQREIERQRGRDGPEPPGVRP